MEPIIELALDIAEPDNVLHIAHDGWGTVTMVYEKDGALWARALEFTDDTDEDSDTPKWVYAYGYSVSPIEPYYMDYMGERYRGMNWGTYKSLLYSGEFRRGYNITL